MTKLITVFGLLLASIYIGHSVSATEEKGETAEIEQSPASGLVVEQAPLSESNTSGSSRTAYIDPETGKLTSHSRAPIVSNQTQQADAEPVKYTTYENGTVGASLGGRFRSPLTATIDCDGSVNTEHTEALPHETSKCEAP